MTSNTEDTRDAPAADLEKAPPEAVKDKDKDDNDDNYPPFAKVIVIMTAVYLAMFLVALVRRPDMQ
jgi:hypothetical protein